MPEVKFEMEPITTKYIMYADGSTAYLGTFDKEGKRVVGLREANGFDVMIKNMDVSLSFPDFSDSAGESR